jgi:hypothetical protein
VRGEGEEAPLQDGRRAEIANFVFQDPMKLSSFKIRCGRKQLTSFYFSEYIYPRRREIVRHRLLGEEGDGGGRRDAVGRAQQRVQGEERAALAAAGDDSRLKEETKREKGKKPKLAWTRIRCAGLGPCTNARAWPVTSIGQPACLPASSSMSLECSFGSSCGRLVIVLCVGWCGRHANEAVPSSSASFLSPCTVIYKSIAVLLSRFFFTEK